MAAGQVSGELKYDAKPICSRPYPVPKVNKEMLKNEVERLVLPGVVEVANDSKCGTPYFAQPKPK